MSTFYDPRFSGGAPPPAGHAPFAGPPPAAGEGFQDLWRYLHALRHRWILIAVCAVLSGAVGLVRYSLTSKEYRAVATIQIERKRLSLLALGQAGWLEDWWNLEYYPTQYRLLRSRGMAERVLRNLRLHEDPEFTGRPATLVPGQAGEATAAEDRAEIGQLAAKLQGGLDVNPVKDTQLVELIYRSSSPELAARVANGYAEAFIEWGIETRTQTVRGASTFLSDQVETLRKEIDERQRELDAYTQSTDVVLDPAGEKLLERRASLDSQYNGAIGERISLEATYRELVSQNDEIVAATHSSGRVNTLRDSLATLEAEYSTKLKSFEPSWPPMRELQRKVEEARAELQQLVRKEATEAREAAHAALGQAERRENVLEAELRKLANEARSLNSEALEYQNRLTNLETRKTLLAELLKRQSETDVASRIQTSSESNVRVVDEAIVPQQAFRPSLKTDLGQALSLGLLGGLGLVLLIELLDRTVKKPEELESLLGLPTLAVIPDIDERSSSGSRLRYGDYGYAGYGYGDAYGYGYGYGEPSGRRSLLDRLRGRPAKPVEETESPESRIELLPHTNPRLAVCEAYRSLRTALLLSSAEELRVVALTSAEPGEGKTATSANLGVVMAQLGRRVLLVDGDLRRPRMHKVFGISNRLGLVNCLTGHDELDRAIAETSVPNLWVCPSGPSPPNPSELLASDRMREILASLRERFDFVLIDTPPALPVADAAILGTLTDGVIVCARAGTLIRDDARACRERLRYSGLRLLGAVLNRYRTSTSRYNRRYNYYGTYGEAPVPAGTPRPVAGRGGARAGRVA